MRDGCGELHRLDVTYYTPNRCAIIVADEIQVFEMSLETARKVLEIEAKALAELPSRLDQRFIQAVETLYACRGRVVVTGMGKSGLIGQKISATLSSTGTPSFSSSCRSLARRFGQPGTP